MLELVWNTPSQRRFRASLNHNISLQYPGIWWVRLTLHDPIAYTKVIVRRSLQTKDVMVARAKRDALVAELQTPEGIAKLEAQLARKQRFPDSRVYGQWRKRQGLPSYTRSRLVRHSRAYLEREKERIAAWRAAKAVALVDAA